MNIFSPDNPTGAYTPFRHGAMGKPHSDGYDGHARGNVRSMKIDKKHLSKCSSQINSQNNSYSYSGDHENETTCT